MEIKNINKTKWVAIGLGGDLPVGTPDLAPPAGQASLPTAPTPQF